MGRVTGGDVLLRLIDDVARLKAQYLDLQATVGGIGSTVRTLQSTVRDVQATVGQLQATVGELQSNVGDLDRRVTALGVGLGETARTVGQMLTHLETYAEVSGEDRARLDDHEDRISRLEKAKA